MAAEVDRRTAMKRLALVGALVVATALVANAAVFVFYPVDITIVPTAPEIGFYTGTNANNLDLAGNTIEVVIPGVTTTDGNATQAYITVHPTLQYTYYYDILRINNTGAITYYVNIYIEATNVSTSFVEAYLIINDTANNVVIKAPINETGFVLDTNLAVPAGASFPVSLLFYTPDSTQFTGTLVVNMSLVYSPSDEQFQPLP